jgi:lysophospholipase L1-like esterase
LAGYKAQEKWDKAVAAFETSATTRPVKTGGTVFIGSSSFTKWKTLEKDMAQFNAVNRGFGGSKTDDLLYYAKRILAPLKPTRIVYYCGSNDLAAKRTPEVVLANFKTFVAMARAMVPNIPVYFIAENAGPKRVPFTTAFEKTNNDVRRWASQTPGVYFIDARDGLFNADGSPKANLFLKDGVHLNDDGYKIWQAHITKALLANPTVTPAVSTR